MLRNVDSSGWQLSNQGSHMARRIRHFGFPYKYPALSSMAAAFIGIWFFSGTDKSKRAGEERERFFAQFVRSQTGLGATGAVAH